MTNFNFYPRALAPSGSYYLISSSSSSSETFVTIYTRKCSQTQIYTWNGSQIQIYTWKPIKCKQTADCKQTAESKQTADGSFSQGNRIKKIIFGQIIIYK